MPERAGAKAAGTGGGRRGGGSTFFPVLMLLVGLAVGIGLTWLVTTLSTRGDSAAPAPTSTVTVTAPTQVVSVPASCLRIADEADVLQQQITTAVDAARSLDASRLSEVVRQLDARQQQVGKTADECRAGLPTSVTTAPTPTNTAPPASSVPATPSP